jgi:hypothetical protein
MKNWERPPAPELWRPPEGEVIEALREADADMPAHIEEYVDQTAYLVGATLERWPKIGAAGALALVKESRHRL